MTDPLPPVDPFGEAVRAFFQNNEAVIATHARACLLQYLEDANEKLDRALKADKCPRETLGNYTIVGLLGEGGYSEVLKAVHRNGTTVAMKVTDKLACEKKPGAIAGAIRERKLLTALNSDFITKMLSAFQDDHNLYLCMEFGYHGDLHCFVLLDEYISERLAKLIAAQIVLALQYLHACSIIHRDLKLPNIMLFKDGGVKLGDFGIAKRTREVTFTLKGTVPYIAPEMIQDRGYHFSVDWWAFGVTVYELLYKVYPFCEREDPPKAQIEGILSKELEIPPRTVPEDQETPPEFSEELRDFLTRLLERDRTRRIRAYEIKGHPWFKDVDFVALFYKRIPLLPWLPPHLDPAECTPVTDVSRNRQLCSDQKAFKGY